MASPSRPGVISDIWSVVCGYQERRGDPGFSISDIKFALGKVRGLPAILVEMPEPSEAGEAYLVALLLRADMEADDPSIGAHSDCYTLELGKSPTGAPRTILCRWEDDQHIELGDGPSPEVAAFVAVIEKHIPTELAPGRQ